MIDTIHIQLHNKHFNQDKMLQTFSDKLAIQHTTNYKQGYQGSSINATYKNFQFFLTNTGLKATGSITKLGNGNNLINASHEAIRSALDHLQDILDIPLREATIKRLDIGYNILLDCPIGDYLRLLIPPSSLTVFTVGDQTKEFRNRLNNLSICFYNKIAEAFKQGKVPAMYQKQNVLRYELRIKTPMLNKLGFIDLRYGDLYDENIYKQLVKVWHDQYLSVPKIVDPHPKRVIINSLTHCRDNFAHIAIQLMGGYEYIISEIKSLPTTKYKTRSDILKWVDKLQVVEGLSPILKEELDAKIYNIYELNG